MREGVPSCLVEEEEVAVLQKVVGEEEVVVRQRVEGVVAALRQWVVVEEEEARLPKAVVVVVVVVELLPLEVAAALVAVRQLLSCPVLRVLHRHHLMRQIGMVGGGISTHAVFS